MGPDQQFRHDLRETVAIELLLDPLEDRELVFLQETGAGTGRFTCSIPIQLALRAVPGNGRLGTQDEATVSGYYDDVVDPSDTATDLAGFVGEAARLHLDKLSARGTSHAGRPGRIHVASCESGPTGIARGRTGTERTPAR